MLPNPINSNTLSVINKIFYKYLILEIKQLCVFNYALNKIQNKLI